MGYKDPFSSFDQNKIFYAIVVGIFSLGTAGLLVIFGPSAYGVSAEGAIWIQDRQDGLNNIKIVLFYVPMSVIYMYCAYTLFILQRRLEVGFGEPLGVRAKIMKRSRIYVISYMSYW